ncbi:methyl-accepting chemotaxis sensory transducer [Caldicellulosiruptor hydrothermalis 108]|uniref:Methyl-accepting chemotaxis sensory transducer n=1 Tax=Caldicellulosiruptor hydrothermalis (strain DSM 18901 / VKM B-2411 / 108) TaxID=632292 RepID=E4Q8R5_CALH1|nr:methyl-accepting chemotaxis protein [Caldicellulosiruptor hydrothermalis]ADQ08039.1 methyl-accepting chemotaxis sensory transducer [Caldicellulosiruptor hydrothermalis 108]
MKVNKIPALIEVLECLPEILQEDINIAVADLEKIVAVHQGNRVRSENAVVGEKLTLDDFLKGILKEKKQVCHISKTSYFNVPTKTIITPVIDENGESCGVIFVTRDVERQSKVEDISVNVFQSFEQINAAIQEMASEANVLANYLSEITDYVVETVNKLGEVSKIILEIKEIVSESNLLALNIKIEAAKMADIGKGVAIVAGEMDKLSRKCKEFAQNTRALLLNMQCALKTVKERISNIRGIAENQAALNEEIAASVEQLLIEVKELSEIAKLS